MADNIQWVRYGFHINDPAVKPVAEAFSGGDFLSVESGQALADLMNAIDKKEGKGLWVSDTGPVEWNFAGCYVEYRGKNSLNFPTKGTMKNVLILVFPETSVKPTGRFYIPYND